MLSGLNTRVGAALIRGITWACLYTVCESRFRACFKSAVNVDVEFRLQHTSTKATASGLDRQGQVYITGTKSSFCQRSCVHAWCVGRANCTGKARLACSSPLYKAEQAISLMSAANNHLCFPRACCLHTADRTVTIKPASLCIQHKAVTSTGQRLFLCISFS